MSLNELICYCEHWLGQHNAGTGSCEAEGCYCGAFEQIEDGDEERTLAARALLHRSD